MCSTMDNPHLNLKSNISEAANARVIQNISFTVSPEESKLLEYRLLDQIMKTVEKKRSGQKTCDIMRRQKKNPMNRPKLVTSVPTFKPSVTTVIQTVPSGSHRNPGIKRGKTLPVGQDINHLMILKESEKTPLLQISKDFRSKQKQDQRDGRFLQGDCSGDKLIIGDVERNTARLSREEIRALRRKRDARKVKVDENKMAETREVILCYKIEVVSVGSIVKGWLLDKMKDVRRWFAPD